jgi:hypothetical protein
LRKWFFEWVPAVEEGLVIRLCLVCRVVIGWALGLLEEFSGTGWASFLVAWGVGMEREGLVGSKA